MRRLLQPHVYATHFGNRIVTPIQLDAGGDFERLFSYTHRGLCEPLRGRRADEFDLRVMDPDDDTTSRRVADLGIDLPALENRRTLMTVIHDHVRRYLAIYYPSDADDRRRRAAGALDRRARRRERRATARGHAR